MLEVGLKHTSELTVSEATTAIQVGSGDMLVLATPMIMALMENAAMLAVKDELPNGCTTVGGHINFCPGWRSYFTRQSDEKRAELRTKYNFTKY